VSGNLANLQQIPLFVWIIIGALLLTQGIWIFLDASRRGDRKFLWGFFGLLSVPGNLVIYLLVTRLLVKTKSCPSCGRRLSAQARYCPHCGVPQEKAE
jgi:hypothetical protein